MKKWVFVLLAGLLLWFGCEFKEPVLPKWFVPVVIPLSEQTFEFRDVLDSTNIVAKGADSLLYIDVEGDIEPTTISRSDLGVKPQDRSQKLEVGTLKLDSLQALNTGFIPLLELFPELNLLPRGSQYTIPETTLTPSVKIVSSDEFKRIHLLRGTIMVHLDNQLPFPIGPNASSSGASFTLKNDSLGTLITQVLIPQVIASGSSGAGSDQIADGGIDIYNRIRLSYSLPIAQATTITVTDSLLQYTGIQINLELKNLEADEVEAKLESQEFDRTVRFGVSGKHQLISGTVDQGAIHVSFQNHTDLSGKIVYSIPNLLTADGAVFTDSITINNSPVQKDIVLDGLTIRNPTDPNIPIDSLEVNVHTRSFRARQYITTRSSDFLQASVTSDSIFFRSFKGILAPESIDVGPFEKHDIANLHRLESTGFNFADVELLLTLFNEIYVENLMLDLQITGFHEDENGQVTQTATIGLTNQQINPGHPGNPGQTQFLLRGQQIIDFLNILPTSIRGEGTVSASGLAEIEQGSHVWGHYQLNAPLRFRIQNLKPIRSGVDTLTREDIAQDIRDAAREDFQEAAIVLNVTNHTPLGATLRLIISGDMNHTDIYDTTYFNPHKEIVKTLRVEPGTVDVTTGYVREAKVSEVVLDLNRDEIRVFSEPPLRVGFELTVDNTQGEVALRSTDFLKVQGITRFQLLVSEK